MNTANEAPLGYLTDDEIIRQALNITLRRMRRIDGCALSSPAAVKSYLHLHFREHQHEGFVVLFLDVKNRLIKREEMFRGTLTQTAVHPREVVKAALAHNAAAVILAHNHPSGVSDASEADKALTARLQQSLALIDVKVLDHIVVAGADAFSFAEHGLI